MKQVKCNLSIQLSKVFIVLSMFFSCTKNNIEDLDLQSQKTSTTPVSISGSTAYIILTKDDSYKNILIRQKGVLSENRFTTSLNVFAYQFISDLEYHIEVADQNKKIISIINFKNTSKPNDINDSSIPYILSKDSFTSGTQFLVLNIEKKSAASEFDFYKVVYRIDDSKSKWKQVSIATNNNRIFISGLRPQNNYQIKIARMLDSKITGYSKTFIAKF